MNVYFQIRSSQLDRSIKGLKEHFRKNSASTGVPYSPAVQTKRKDTPTKKVPKRPGQRWFPEYHWLHHGPASSLLNPTGPRPHTILCNFTPLIFLFLSFNPNLVIIVYIPGKHNAVVCVAAVRQAPRVAALVCLAAKIVTSGFLVWF